MTEATSATAPYHIRMKRTFAAPQEKAFAAWTEPERIAKWLGRSNAQAITEVIEQDLRPGGRYRFHITSPEGKHYKLIGTYREVSPYSRLVFTWSWDGNDAFGETLVTVEFRRLGQSNFTEIELKHELFLTEADRNGHNQGWEACFDMMPRAFL